VEALVQAEAMLLTNQIAAGTLVVYERGLRYWRVWRVWRRRAPFLLGGREAREDENGLIRFVAYFGVVCEYANSTLHCWLHGIRHAHVVPRARGPARRQAAPAHVPPGTQAP
jgi:hypothetical protein